MWVVVFVAVSTTIATVTASAAMAFQWSAGRQPMSMTVSSPARLASSAPSAGVAPTASLGIVPPWPAAASCQP